MLGQSKSSFGDTMFTTSVVWLYLATVVGVALSYHPPYLYRRPYYPVSHYRVPPPPPLSPLPPPPPPYPAMSPRWIHRPLQRVSHWRKPPPSPGLYRKRTYDTLHESSSNLLPVRYVPIVKKVTHHHVHHIVSAGSSGAEDPQINMAHLGRLLIKSLYNMQHHYTHPNDLIAAKLRKSGAALSLMADSSNRVPLKDEEPEEETEDDKESERDAYKPNQDIMFEDEVDSRTKKLKDEDEGQVEISDHSSRPRASVGPRVIPFEQLAIRLAQHERRRVAHASPHSQHLIK